MGFRSATLGDLIERIKNAIKEKAPEVIMVNDAPGKAALVLFEMFSSYRKKELQSECEYKTESLVERKY